MKKISIKEFVKGYSNCATQQLKDRYIKEKLEIIPYISFVTKDALIDRLLKVTMFDKETGNIKVNSSAEYLLKTRIFVENYTNLIVETQGFYEEYDELKKSGLFDILFIGDKNNDPLVPIVEMAEFNHLLDVKRNDIYTNKYELHSFITEQIDRIKALGEATLTPLVSVVKEKLDSLSEEDLGKFIELAKKGDFKEV